MKTISPCSIRTMHNMYGLLDIGNPMAFDIVPLLQFSVPGLLLGFVVDELTQYLQDSNVFGSRVEMYVFLETLFILAVKYVLVMSFPVFATHWQVSLYGIFFIGFFWGMLMTYFQNLRILLESWSRTMFTAKPQPTRVPKALR